MSAKINDMYYAYSAIDDIKEKGEYGGVVTTPPYSPFCLMSSIAEYA